MKHPVRRLNENGLLAFSSYFVDLQNDPKKAPPHHVLKDERYSEVIDTHIELEDTNFSTRFDMGQYLVNAFSGADIQPLLGDSGFWSWIALFWFEQICPARADGTRKASQAYNYILRNAHKII